MRRAQFQGDIFSFDAQIKEYRPEKGNRDGASTSDESVETHIAK